MPTAFSHTLRSLERRPLITPWVFVIIGAFGSLCWWSTHAEVNVYLSSRRARVETTSMVHTVSPATDGRVVRLNLALEQKVHEGEVLVVMDDSVERAMLAQENAMLTSLQTRLEALRARIATEDMVETGRIRVGKLAMAQAGVRLRQARVEAELRQDLERISDELYRHQLNTAIESRTTQGARAAGDLSVESAQVESGRIRAVEEFESKQAIAKIGMLRAELASLDAEVVERMAAVRTATARVDRLVVRAPIDGTVSSVSTVRPGDVVHIGQELATIVTAGDVQIVAEFAPTEAAGRLFPGQNANVRFDGFSWTQYGILTARVAKVAVEPTNGLNRAELVVESSLERWRLQHGMTGVVDVQVERMSPWHLVLRDLGSGALASKRYVETREGNAVK